MKTYTLEELQQILKDHKERLTTPGGICADLSGADLRRADLSGADLRRADLSGADLSGADLSGADLRRADLRRADLSGADLRRADLRRADLRRADLRRADLSGAQNLLNPVEFLEKNFEKTKAGIIVYKSFAEHYSPNPNWKIENDSIIEEVVNPERTNDCGCGVNVATLDWTKKECNNPVWECLIKWEWLAGVVVPYNTNGKIRASRVQLIKPLK